MQFMGELQPLKRLFVLRGGAKLHKVRHLFKPKLLFAYTPSVGRLGVRAVEATHLQQRKSSVPPLWE